MTLRVHNKLVLEYQVHRTLLLYCNIHIRRRHIYIRYAQCYWVAKGIISSKTNNCYVKLEWFNAISRPNYIHHSWQIIETKNEPNKYVLDRYWWFIHTLYWMHVYYYCSIFLERHDFLYKLKHFSLYIGVILWINRQPPAYVTKHMDKVFQTNVYHISIDRQEIW